MSATDDAADLAQKIISATYPRVSVFDYEAAEKRDVVLRLARAVLDLRAENAAMRKALATLRFALSLTPCLCSVAVQPPHALKCERCRALETTALAAKGAA